MFADFPNTNLPGVAPAFPGGVKFRKLPPPAAPAGLGSDEGFTPPPKIDGVAGVAAPPKNGFEADEVEIPPKVGFAEAELPKKEGFGPSGSDCRGVAFGTPNAKDFADVVLAPNAVGLEADCFSSGTGGRGDFVVKVAPPASADSFPTFAFEASIFFWASASAAFFFFNNILFFINSSCLDSVAVWSDFPRASATFSSFFLSASGFAF
mmetsp:Transcript_23501/g.36788  ORF Transcript_23501/g.36788 Transcript_23501/m.36788 type:complete len:208 (-) Transcript_23501:5257-5880(-)